AQITGWTGPSVIATASGTATGINQDEDTATGTTIATFVATPSGGDSIASYELLTTGTPFEISSPAGVLTLSTALDFETTTTYTIEVKATDNNGTPNSGTATLVITVTDVNEATPTFSATSYTVCVTDASAAGTTVTTFSATDADTSDTITYSINTGNTNTDFEIATAELKVATGKTLDRNTTASYTLVIHAEDSVATVRTGSATYTVNVQTSCSSGAAALTITFITLFLALISSLN
ncbi:protocadherin beta-15-like, partial [Ruditapes philippinarum]|uniref:protocadherin beta-15-like n=1 Tax=Ruditapes philippinarum TaxID=129788 RepID=UPI00295C214D